MPTGTLRHVRLTNSGKLADRYLTVQVKGPTDPEKRDTERFFAILEIENPLYPTAQVGQTIINTAAREYYRGEDQDAVANFERALKKVNETLAHFARSGDAEWIGQLHGILALINGSDVHVAPTGSAHGWLARHSKVTRVFDAQPAETIPEKTFGAVISGALEPSDQLLFATSGLIEAIPDSTLADTIFPDMDFSAVALRLASTLKNKRAQWVNALIVEAVDPAKRPQLSTPLPETLYLDTSSVTNWQLAVTSTARQLHNSFLHARGWLKSANTHIDGAVRHRVLPRATEHVDQATRWAKAQLARLRPTPATPAPLPLAQQAEKQTENPERGAESLIGQPIFAVNDYRAPEPVNVPSPTSTSTHRIREYNPFPAVTTTRTLPRLRSLTTALRSARLPDYRTLWLPTTTGLLALMLVVNLYAMTKGSAVERARADAQAALTSLEDKLEEAKLAKIFNQPDKAIDGFQSVLSGATALSDSPVAEHATRVRDDAQSQLDALTSTTRLTSPELILSIKNGSAVAVWGNRVTVAQGTTTVTTSASGGESTTTTLTSNAVDLVGLGDGSALAVITDSLTGHRITDPAGAPDVLGSAESWKKSTRLATFLGNLYALAPSEGQIWKYPAKEGSFGGAEPYVADGTTLTNGIDIAIDGSIYVLTQEGSVMKFTRGKAVEFRVRDIPKPSETISAPKRIATSEESGSVYVIDGQRIIALDKTGRFQKQYALNDGTGALIDLALTPDSKRAYVLTDSAVYAFPL
ncbi:MAG: hypothetical protein ACOYBJ_01560 [Patescibacteria group bacterium]|jgi:hypothetical protein